ncbi:MAG: hypothetical protein WCI11_11415 [Candidatus Methylumidiphilus sp.]
MQPIRQIIQDAPDYIPVPLEFRHRPIEFILWPLEETSPTIETGEPQFLIADVEDIIMPSRDERNARK